MDTVNVRHQESEVYHRHWVHLEFGLCQWMLQIDLFDLSEHKTTHLSGLDQMIREMMKKKKFQT